MPHIHLKQCFLTGFNFVSLGDGKNYHNYALSVHKVYLTAQWPIFAGLIEFKI